ncbi:MAG TPA: flavin reductase family protein [Candidatus Binataceae bacterium]|nr:flavin reductase family protein [Candidatus Binataceae bacterium]
MDDALMQFLGALTTGIYVLTVAENGRCHGMSSSWVTQVSGAPPLFSAAVDNQHLSRAVIERTRRFGLNIVGRRGRELEDYFYSPAARRADNLENIDYVLSPRLGVPWLKSAMAAVAAEVVQELVAGDHTIYIARPQEIRIESADRPLTSLDLDYVYLGGRTVIARDRRGWE